jgi:hypothetical protein
MSEKNSRNIEYPGQNHEEKNLSQEEYNQLVEQFEKEPVTDNDIDRVAISILADRGEFDNDDKPMPDILRYRRMKRVPEDSPSRVKYMKNLESPEEYERMDDMLTDIVGEINNELSNLGNPGDLVKQVAIIEAIKDEHESEKERYEKELSYAKRRDEVDENAEMYIWDDIDWGKLEDRFAISRDEARYNGEEELAEVYEHRLKKAQDRDVDWSRVEKTLENEVRLISPTENTEVAEYRKKRLERFLAEKDKRHPNN